MRWIRAAILVTGFVLLLVSHAVARPGGGGSFRGGSSTSSSGGSRSGSSSSGSFRSGSSTSSSGSSYRSSSSSSSGGVSFSSSSSSGSYSSGGGGGGGGGIVLLLLVGGIAFAIVFLWFVFSRNSAPAIWSTGQTQTPYYPYTPPPQPRTGPRRALERLLETDPNFSPVLFDDFLVALYTEVHMARGRGKLQAYAPYLGSAAMQTLSASPSPGEITSVIVGSVTMEDVRGAEPGSTHVWVKLVFESNYSVRGPQGESALYVQEEWTLNRRAGVKSRTPDKARVIGCPCCGAPLDVVVGGVCKHCSTDVTAGNFDWQVDSVAETAREARGPMLTGTVAEEGTNLPTMIDPQATPRFTALTHADPGTTWANVEARLRLVFHEFQIGWASRDLTKMRPFMSDALFTTQTYWVTEYQRQGLRNITENARIERAQLARVTTDAFYDAITIRFWARSLDYTIADATNQIVGGHRTQERAYSEYWTFIRGRGAKGPPRLEKVCPKCGAPLSVSMGGDCTYCSAKVTSGEFDWVLSRIEQDEVYQG